MLIRYIALCALNLWYYISDFLSQNALFFSIITSLEYFYRKYRGWSGKRQLRRCLRLHVRRTRLRSDRVFVAAKYILANNSQLLYAGSSGGRLQYRRLELSMGRGRYFWNESITDTTRRLSDPLFPSPQQLSGIRSFHEDLEKPTIVSKQLSWVSGILILVSYIYLMIIR